MQQVLIDWMTNSTIIICHIDNKQIHYCLVKAYILWSDRWYIYNLVKVFIIRIFSSLYKKHNRLNNLQNWNIHMYKAWSLINNLEKKKGIFLKQVENLSWNHNVAYLNFKEIIVVRILWNVYLFFHAQW